MFRTLVVQAALKRQYKPIGFFPIITKDKSIVNIESSQKIKVKKHDLKKEIIKDKISEKQKKQLNELDELDILQTTTNLKLFDFSSKKAILRRSPNSCDYDYINNNNEVVDITNPDPDLSM